MYTQYDKDKKKDHSEKHSSDKEYKKKTILDKNLKSFDV